MNSNSQLPQEPEPWQQGQLVEITIENLSDRGDGVGKFQGRVVFVPDTVPGDRVVVRLLRVKRDYAHGKFTELLEPSPHRIRPSCIVADKCGGCQWQHIDYQYQLQAKQDQVRQALIRIGGLEPSVLTPTLGTAPLGYRNKATYPLKRSATGQVQAGYYQKGSHLLVNLNQCPVQDSRLNPLLAEVKQDLQARGWSIYDEQKHQGRLRHLSLRIGRATGEMLLTLISTSPDLQGLPAQAEEWLRRYPGLVGVLMNVNSDRTNVIFGKETHCVAGRPYLQEKFAGLEWELPVDTFFQVHPEAAAALLGIIQERLQLTGDEVLLDAYCGIGTFTLPLAGLVHQAIGLEIQGAAVQQAERNALLNHISNVTFHQGKVEDLLPTLPQTPDIILLDPPRQGCDRQVLQTIIDRQPPRLVYVSCKPSTLARDLKILTEGGYSLELVNPVDFFPQTSHVEAVAFLRLEDT
jgi:23S rRNA (uracil1939-C5)-methyltransferase